MHNTKFQSNAFSTAIWLVLVALTVATFSIGEAGLAGKNIMLVLLAIAIVKGQMVVSYFMGLAKTRLLWRAIMFSYLAIVGSMIAVAYVMGLK